MVIFKNKQKIKQLQQDIKNLNEKLNKCFADSFEQIKELKKQIIDLKETIENLQQNNGVQKTAQQLMTEYLFGEETK